MPFTQPENPKPVRAKMFVSSIELQTWGTVIKLNVVTRGEDNKQWASATPQGELRLVVKNEHASDQFAPGQEWFIDMIPIPTDRSGSEGMD